MGAALRPQANANILFFKYWFHEICRQILGYWSLPNRAQIDGPSPLPARCVLWGMNIALLWYKMLSNTNFIPWLPLHYAEAVKDGQVLIGRRAGVFGWMRSSRVLEWCLFPYRFQRGLRCGVSSDVRSGEELVHFWSLVQVFFTDRRKGRYYLT
jgi:hypothetical protein